LKLTGNEGQTDKHFVAASFMMESCGKNKQSIMGNFYELLYSLLS